MVNFQLQIRDCTLIMVFNRSVILLFLLLLPLMQQAAAQTGNDTDRKELHDLLDERKKKFDDYTLSIQKHSGIFGNKTKNDLNNTKEVLIDIVKTDNRIISNLYRVVDFRTFEKVNTNYDLKKNDEVLNNLRHATDTLTKQVEVLTKTNKQLKSRSTRLYWFVYALSFLSIWLLVVLWRKRPQRNIE